MKISADKLNFALKNLQTFGDTNIFPLPFEYSYIEESDLKWILSRDTHLWQTSEPIKCLVAKKLKGFRPSTLLNPVDTIFYTAVILEGGALMEESRIPTEENVVFSHRFKLDPSKFTCFDQQIGHNEFIEHSKKLAKEYSHVLVTDIADFFPRVYLHDIERTVRDASNPDYEKTISNFLKKLNVYETVDALPVGTEASSFLSNILLNDLDRSLEYKGVVFCRFMDDFRIFGDSKEHCFEKMYEIAMLLHERYHLSLQQSKTKILDRKQYLSECNFLTSEGMDDMMRKLTELNKEILAQEFATGEYEPISYDELDDETKAKIDEFNLDIVLEDELKKDRLNLDFIRKILKLSERIQSFKILEVIIEKLDQLFPVLDTALKYLIAIADKLGDKVKPKIVSILLALLMDAPYTSMVPFYRVWILETLLVYATAIGNKDRTRLLALYDTTDNYTKRQIILLMGVLDCKFWFRERKIYFSSLNDWQKTAFIKGFSDCSFSESEKKAFLKSIAGLVNEKDQYLLKLLR